MYDDLWSDLVDDSLDIRLDGDIDAVVINCIDPVAVQLEIQDGHLCVQLKQLGNNVMA